MMVALGIGVLIIGIITYIWSTLSFCDEKYALAILLVILATFFCSVGLCWMISEDNTHERTIECSEIKQIDTLYKNDSIIGYEIIYMK